MNGEESIVEDIDLEKIKLKKQEPPTDREGESKKEAVKKIVIPLKKQDSSEPPFNCPGEPGCPPERESETKEPKS
jgi:hypothetical protein